LLSVLHIAAPSVFAAPLPLPNPSNPYAKISMVILMLLLAGSLSAQTATPSTGPLSTSAGPVMVYYNGTASAGSITKQLYDFKDFGATKSNHIVIGVDQLIAPAPNFQVYEGTFGVAPDLTKVFAGTNVPAGTIGAFFDAGAGVVEFPSSTGVGWHAGAAAKWRAATNLSWNVGEVRYQRVGSRNVLVVSSSISLNLSGLLK
jgi:hypothetical protein